MKILQLHHFAYISNTLIVIFIVSGSGRNYICMSVWVTTRCILFLVQPCTCVS